MHVAKHGTRTMYVHYGCRCDECCRAEHAQYLKRPEAKARKHTYSKHGDIPLTAKSDSKRASDRRRWTAIASRPRAHAKTIRWQEVAELYGMTCSMCGIKTDPTDTWLSETGRKCFGRRYPTVDHIVAIKNGGTDTFDNVQLLCKRCNSKKGAS